MQWVSHRWLKTWWVRSVLQNTQRSSLSWMQHWKKDRDNSPFSPGMSQIYTWGLSELANACWGREGYWEEKVFNILSKVTLLKRTNAIWCFFPFSWWNASLSTKCYRLKSPEVDIARTSNNMQSHCKRNYKR